MENLINDLKEKNGYTNYKNIKNELTKEDNNE